ncbi:MAG: efflux RND transporter permease subunit, partial [Cellvibrionaceae bacterium]|nr:efflux RND transporter permease subunit [Cellvibrionaceae bacterium]
MHFLTNWFIRNPVAANLVMVVILVAGLMSLWGIRIEGFPRIPPDTISVSTYYPGASAVQVDESVTSKLESALEGLPGVKKVFSVSYDEMAEVRVQKKTAYSLDRLLDDVRSRIDNIATLPQAAERPAVKRDEFNFPAMIVQVYGSVDQHSLQRLARQVKETLLAQPEISRIKQWGERKYEMSITIAPERLQSLGLSFEDVTAAIQQSSVRYRTGVIKSAGGRIQVRADDYLDQRLEFDSIVLLDQGDGAVVRLGDIAEIDNGFVDEDVYVLFQGQPAIGFEIVIGQKDNLLDVSRVTQRVLQQLREEFPDNVKLASWVDQSNYISERLDTLKSNAIQGLILVFILLALFLSPKLAFWVALGIPISLAGTLAIMGWHVFDYSLNDITTFGMIIVLGILVDDAVVVGESVYSERQHIKDRIKGTEAGVAKVATATIFGVLTTVAAFYPMTTIQNPLGQVLASFSVVVIIALLFSLFESKFILPAHLAETGIDKDQAPSGALQIYWGKLQAFLSDGLDSFNNNTYRPLLRRCIEHRYACLIGFLAAAVLALGLIKVNAVRVTFFPDIPGSLITATIEMDKRASIGMTLDNTERLRETLDTINQRFADSAEGGSPPVSKLMTAVIGPTSISAYAELVPDSERNTNTLEIVDAWRRALVGLEGVVSMELSGSEQ